MKDPQKGIEPLSAVPGPDDDYRETSMCPSVTVPRGKSWRNADAGLYGLRLPEAVRT